MSIVILGMEMPENCDNCFFCDEWAKCQLLNLNNIFDYCKNGIERPAKCPLLPLPDKHGRLGDLDKLEESLRMMAAYQTGERQQGVLGCCETIRMAKSIVPAEGGTEDG